MKNKLKLVEKVIKMIKKDAGYGKYYTCEDFNPGCGACQAYLLIGLLNSYRDDLKWVEK